MALRRLDSELVRRGLVESRERARALIEAGHVRVNAVTAEKPARQVDTADAITIAERSDEWASRGAGKLVSALEVFLPGGLRPLSGRRCLDAGASTGGFTDVLLRGGAAAVVAVDVGYGQLVWRLRSDPRVIVMDRTNVRNLQPSDVPWPPDLVVADLSFISLVTVLPALSRVADPSGDLVLMVKPQFEVGRGHVGRSGVVRDRSLHADAIRGVAAVAEQLGWGTAMITASMVPGPSGNIEYFVWLHAGAGPVADDVIAKAIAEGPTT